MRTGLQSTEGSGGTARYIQDVKDQQEMLATRVEKSKLTLRVELRDFRKTMVTKYASLVNNLHAVESR